tara:strand:- start:1770 stop:1946 length:177 start_codon:yes stop_codon:yes gene_type:complete
MDYQRLVGANKNYSQSPFWCKIVRKNTLYMSFPRRKATNQPTAVCPLDSLIDLQITKL